MGSASIGWSADKDGLNIDVYGNAIPSTKLECATTINYTVKISNGSSKTKSSQYSSASYGAGYVNNSITPKKTKSTTKKGTSTKKTKTKSSLYGAGSVNNIH
ncbi:MAG: hypothetical protein IPF54_16045 [Draconibacterium sp.]|nr:hypothetical protein [Draconibacterium sp.]